MPLPPSLQRCIYRHPPSSHVRLPHGLTHRFEGEKRRGSIFIQDVLEDCINSLFASTLIVRSTVATNLNMELPMVNYIGDTRERWGEEVVYPCRGPFVCRALG